jgi:hypothetical protein
MEALLPGQHRSFSFCPRPLPLGLIQTLHLRIGFYSSFNICFSFANEKVKIRTKGYEQRFP